MLVERKEGTISESSAVLAISPWTVNGCAFFLLRFIANPQLSSYTVCLEDKARLSSKKRGIKMKEGNAGGVGTSGRHIQQKEINSGVKNTEQKSKLNKFLLQLVKFL